MQVMFTLWEYKYRYSIVSITEIGVFNVSKKRNNLDRDK